MELNLWNFRVAKVSFTSNTALPLFFCRSSSTAQLHAVLCSQSIQSLEPAVAFDLMNQDVPRINAYQRHSQPSYRITHEAIVCREQRQLRLRHQKATVAHSNRVQNLAVQRAEQALNHKLLAELALKHPETTNQIHLSRSASLNNLAHGLPCDKLHDLNSHQTSKKQCSSVQSNNKLSYYMLSLSMIDRETQYLSNSVAYGKPSYYIGKPSYY